MLYQGHQGHQWFNKKRGALRASMIRFFSTDFTDLTDVGCAFGVGWVRWGVCADALSG